MRQCRGFFSLRQRESEQVDDTCFAVRSALFVSVAVKEITWVCARVIELPGVRISVSVARSLNIVSSGFIMNMNDMCENDVVRQHWKTFLSDMFYRAKFKMQFRICRYLVISKIEKTRGGNRHWKIRNKLECLRGVKNVYHSHLKPKTEWKLKSSWWPQRAYMYHDHSQGICLYSGHEDMHVPWPWCIKCKPATVYACTMVIVSTVHACTKAILRACTIAIAKVHACAMSIEDVYDRVRVHESTMA